MLRTNSITINYGKNNIIKDLSLNIKKGSINTMIGTNGCGKSTILKALSRNLKPQYGDVYLNGKSIFQMDTKLLAKDMSILPQSPTAPDDFTVFDLVSYGRYPHLDWTAKLHKEDYDIINWSINLTKLEHLKDRQVTTLSGGERQRAWIAMALCQKPKILLLDEPTTYLDISHQFEVLELVKNLNKSMGLTIVMVLHDLNQAARYSDNIIVIKDGNIYKQGPPQNIITEQILQDVFKLDVRIILDEYNNCPFFIPIMNHQLPNKLTS
ncbi:iron-dicitrate ABC transporter ATP-binding protein [Vallitalea longa]|uniref:Iron-dicitrate ABC transporter ATP-binding protein n=1 Tax=Vallitalea longa TaxID=2936439 RepID=A0A9W6DH80_9FIRM|nr:ABC transporter ATP-binding protein [Vallitalea longa]GKX31292.1 iron-dicitrate ABC transporter ATP-binding protein [Vallitalea longa]